MPTQVNQGRSAVSEPEASGAQATKYVAANLYELSGHLVHVTYASTAFDGKPHLTYQDATQTLNFRGDQIETIQSELGELVSVPIRRTVDAGSTTFTLFVPRVNVAPLGSAAVRTEGVTTIHKSSLVPSILRGQLDVYTVIPLHGSASQVAP
jgi:hypothetical protein